MITDDPQTARKALWTAGILRWKLWDQQLPIYDAVRGLPPGANTVVALCARQFGKSFLGCTMAIEDCLRNPGTSILVCGPTIKQTTDIVNQSIRKLTDDVSGRFIKRSKQESRWYVGDSELLIGGFDINNSTRVRGKNLFRIYLEELVDSHPDSYLEAIRSDLGPAMTHSPDGRMVFLTTLPRIPAHPFIVDTIPEAKLCNAFFSYTIDDNKQLTPDQYDACVRRSGGKHTTEFRREYLNEIVRDRSVLVVPDFEPKMHVNDFSLPARAFYQVTIDWGGTRDFTVALLHSYDFMAAKHIILDERVFEPNTSTEKIIKEITRLESEYDIERRTADLPGQLAVDLAATYNYTTSLPPKSDWQSGVNGMSILFSLNQILINPKCKFLVATCESGQFNKNRTDFDRTTALGHCDALAALMYAVRVQRVDSPYGSNVIAARPMSNQIGIHAPDDMIEIKVGNAIQPRTFGKVKRF